MFFTTFAGLGAKLHDTVKHLIKPYYIGEIGHILRKVIFYDFQ
jgi:hypothetical protein